MRRVLWFLIVLLALAAAPALCQSGVVEHECACAPGVSACSHENACSDDPCGTIANATVRTALPTPGSMVAIVPAFLGLQHAGPQRSALNTRPIRFDLLRRDAETSTVVLVV